MEDQERIKGEFSRHIIDSSLYMIIAVDRDRKIIEFNKSAEKTFGYRNEEVLGSCVDMLYCDPGEGLKVHEAVRREGRFAGEITNRRKDGRTFKTFLSASLLRYEGGEHVGFMGISMDITEKKRSEETLKESERFLNTIFDSIKDPFSIVDRDYRIIRVNGAYAEMRNRKIGDLIGERCYEVLRNRTSACDDCVVKKTFDFSDPCAKDKLLTFPGGAKIWVEIFTYPILGEDGRVSHVIEYTRDITVRKNTEAEMGRLIEKLEYLSSTDALTALLNRRVLIDRLNYEVERAKRFCSHLSLVLCDIDHFKDVNDDYGHADGDRVLQVIAGILRDKQRETDIVGRYGGDEFMLILPGTSIEGAVLFAEKIRSAVDNTAVGTKGGISIKTSLSIGCSSFGQDVNDIDSLMRHADTALYTSKRSGRNRVSVIK